jgi:hypothetical protein
VAGGAFSAAVLAQLFAFPYSADSSAPPAAIVAYYVHHGRSDLIADYLSLVATPLLVVFLCGMAARASERARRVALVAMAAAAALEFSATAIELALGSSVVHTAPAATTGALFQVASRLFFAALVWLGVAVGAIASTSPARPWLRGLGAITAVLLVGAGAAAAEPHGPLGILLLPAEALLVVWALAAALSREPARQPSTDAVSTVRA